MTHTEAHDSHRHTSHTDWYVKAMERLVTVIQELSHARDLESIMIIVRKAARDLTGADGATFVLRDGDKCYYAEENAISPLWKGQRFPMQSCISGWVMINEKPVVIEDIYKDPRIPIDAYRPTFVKSLAMVPIRQSQPVGAIGNYWAKNRTPSAEEMTILQALAHVTSVAMENVELYTRLQEKVKALETSNDELSHFAWAASHDLKTPLRGVDTLSAWVQEDIDSGAIDKVKGHVKTLRHRVQRMEKLLDDILEYSQVERKLYLHQSEMTDGKTLKGDVLTLIDVPPGFTVNFSERFDSISVPRLALQRVLCNLIGNAIKHHDRDQGTVDIDVSENDARYLFTVKDDGPGIPKEYQTKVFEMFQTLKPIDAKEGSGMGLTLAQKILHLHGGDVTLQSGPGRGTTFSLIWPKKLIR